MRTDSETESGLTFCIPASPTESFYSQIAFFRLSLDRLGGIYEKSKLIVFLGDERYEPLPERWRPVAKKISFVQVDSARYKQMGYFAQGEARLNYPLYNTELVILCDADTALLAPIDEAITQVLKTRTMAGVIAHYPPPMITPEVWDKLFREFAGKSGIFSEKYTLLEQSEDGPIESAPYYINYGFAIFHLDYLRQVGPIAVDLRNKITARLPTPFFSAQVSLAVAVRKLAMHCDVLTMDYNFPNDEVADRLYPSELQRIKLIHYLRTNKFSRDLIFSTSKGFYEFLEMKLEGSNRIFQDHVRRTTEGVYQALLFPRDASW